jgi:hypothetical protein
MMLALILGVGGASAEDLAAGLKSYQQGDYGAALQPLARAGGRGSAQAQALLGWMYLHGEGVVQDPAQAASWLRKAALQGNAGAQFNLGQLYTKGGSGIGQDFTLALEWFEKAGNQGDPRAQYNAGVIHANAQGVGRNYVEAYKWFLLAQANGSAEAAGATSYVQTKISREDMDDAQRRADEWSRAHRRKR